MARQSLQDPPPAEMLEQLSDSHWKQFRDVHWPGRTDEKLDHVLVGPSGVYVIDYCDQSLLQDRQSFDLTVDACSESSRAVGGLLPGRYRSRVKPIVCFRAHAALGDLVDGVTVTSYMALEHILRFSPVVLSTAEVSEVFTYLRDGLEPIPVAQAQPRRRWAARRILLAAVAATVTVVGGLAFGPELVEAARLW